MRLLFAHHLFAPENVWYIFCGTYVKLLEMARDYIEDLGKFELIGGYFSPVSDQYSKEGLISATHRTAMCQLAVDCTSDWLMVDSWESRQTEYQPSVKVLDHFNKKLNVERNGISTPSGIGRGDKTVTFRAEQEGQNHVARRRRPNRVLWISGGVGPSRRNTCSQARTNR